jgi:hypothetical protein
MTTAAFRVQESAFEPGNGAAIRPTKVLRNGIELRRVLCERALNVVKSSVHVHDYAKCRPKVFGQGSA